MTKTNYNKTQYEVNGELKDEETRIEHILTGETFLENIRVSKIPLPVEDGFLFTADYGERDQTNIIKITGQRTDEEKVRVNLVLISDTENVLPLKIIDEELTRGIECLHKID